MTQEQELLTFAGILVHPKVFGGSMLLFFVVFLCCVFLLVTSCLCSVSCVQMLPVSLDCPSLIVPSGFSHVYWNESSCEYSDNRCRIEFNTASCGVILILILSVTGFGGYHILCLKIRASSISQLEHVMFEDTKPKW